MIFVTVDYLLIHWAWNLKKADAKGWFSRDERQPRNSSGHPSRRPRLPNGPPWRASDTSNYNAGH